MMGCYPLDEIKDKYDRINKGNVNNDNYIDEENEYKYICYGRYVNKNKEPNNSINCKYYKCKEFNNGCNVKKIVYENDEYKIIGKHNHKKSNIHYYTNDKYKKVNAPIYKKSKFSKNKIESYVKKKDVSKKGHHLTCLDTNMVLELMNIPDNVGDIVTDAIYNTKPVNKVTETNNKLNYGIESIDNYSYDMYGLKRIKNNTIIRKYYKCKHIDCKAKYMKDYLIEDEKHTDTKNLDVVSVIVKGNHSH